MSQGNLTTNQVYTPATLGGRCANGYERGQGIKVHAIPFNQQLETNDYCMVKAVCGAKPGALSVGWCKFAGDITCPRCLKRLLS